MKLENIDIDQTIKSVKQMLEQETGLSPAFKPSLQLLLVLITLLVNRLGLNSKNSSKPPSSDPNREKLKKPKGERKPGGQKGHNRATLKKVADPDIVEVIKLDRSILPEGDYRELEPEPRQVIDIDISKIVTEYQAQVLEDQNGKRYVADFPEDVTRPVQYGLTVKAQAVYLSQYQLIPYQRIEENFLDQSQIPLSAGSIYNFNEEAYDRLEAFEQIVTSKLIGSNVLHSDETGINIDGKGNWLHCTSNDQWTLFYAHPKRGHEATDEIGVLPHFKGVLCHDHWKPYFRYDCSHALCNAHHLRELECAWEQDHQKWAKNLQSLLIEMNQRVKDVTGALKSDESERYREKYRQILKSGESESPPPDEKDRQGKRGRISKLKSRNLLERLLEFEIGTLRFLEDPNVPFTNN